MLENLSLKELETEKKRVLEEIKRVYCSRNEEANREAKLQELYQIRDSVKEGIKAFHSVRLSDIQGIQARA